MHGFHGQIKGDASKPCVRRRPFHLAQTTHGPSHMLEVTVRGEGERSLQVSLEHASARPASPGQAVHQTHPVFSVKTVCWFFAIINIIFGGPCDRKTRGPISFRHGVKHACFGMHAIAILRGHNNLRSGRPYRHFVHFSVRMSAVFSLQRYGSRQEHS
jgi:hypothetical protein